MFFPKCYTLLPWRTLPRGWDILVSHRHFPRNAGATANAVVGVDAIGSISVDFTGVDMSSFQTRYTPTGIEYNLQYQIKIGFRFDEGVLKFFCVSNGKPIGATTISFTG